MDPESVGKRNAIPLIEICSILYLGDDEVPPEKQLGTIGIRPIYARREDLYKVDKVDMKNPSIKFGDPIMVTGAPITKFQEFDIEFELFCGTYTDRIEVVWDEPQEDEVCYIEERIKSGDGTNRICVQYGLFGSATIANVRLTWARDNDYIHGFVMASNSRADLPTRASILFWRESNHKIPVRNGGVIPLSKSSVGVPLDSEFFLAISLVCDNEKFETKLTLVNGSSFRQLYFDHKLELTVTWD